MFPAQDGQVVWVSTPWHTEPVVARVVEARFAFCTVRYYGDVVLYTYEWHNVHLNVADALNRQRVCNRQAT